MTWTPPENSKDAVGPKALFYNIEMYDPQTDSWEAVNDSPIRSNSFKGFYTFSFEIKFRIKFNINSKFLS